MSILEEALGEGLDQEVGSQGQQTRYEYDPQGNLLRQRSGQESVRAEFRTATYTMRREYAVDAIAD
ncbi:hypothetical protein [Paenibacillus polymyxa]|uniref:hypothetical protein n=1 Tax=Paenibacillus polymyxa TaxID=1406 RepID=UPI0004BA997C|nr:hypothetical protein [Paenibacillus polymyxa]